MIRLGMIALLAGTLFLAGAFISKCVVAQDFPYSVPQAPEFDHRGNYMQPGTTDEDDGGHRQRSRAYSRSNRNELRYGEAKPYVPDSPPTRSRRRTHRVQSYAPPPPGPPSMASNQPSAPPPQMQQRPDCSQYPMMIARAQNEPDMRMIARRYLSCLLQNGWPMERARAQVISTIESTYRLAR